MNQESSRRECDIPACFFKEDHMTLQEVLDLADQLKPNMMQRSVKVRFINEIEGKVHQEILMKHVHSAEDEILPEYDDTTDGSEQLLVQAPYHMLYVYWLMAQIDHMNMEMDKYNNDRALFEAAWGDFDDYWTRTHMPLTVFPYFKL